MKIAFLSLTSGIAFRGVETTTHNLGNYLSKKHKVTVYCGGNKKFLKQNYTTKVYKTKLLNDLKLFKYTDKLLWRVCLDSTSISIIFFTIKVFKDLYVNNYKVVIPENGFWQILAVKVLKLFRPQTKILIIGHSGFGWSERLNIYLGGDVFVMQTPKGVNYAKSLNKRLNVKLIPSGVDTAKFVPKDNYKKKKPYNILCVASLVPYKQIDNLIKSFKYLNKNYNLTILGNGPLKSYLLELCKKYVKSSYSIGSCSHDKIVSYYQKCDLFCLPSNKQEAFGLVILEAMACNKPVVVNNDSVRRWMVKDAGILTDCSDPKKIAKSIIKVCNTNWKKKPLKQAKVFSTNVVFAKYQSLLESL